MRWLASTGGWISAAITDRAVRTGLFVLLAVPLALLAVDVWREFLVPGSGLGPDPADELVRTLGTWGLRILLLTLAVSPASRVLRQPRLIRFRRMVGLWAFAYVVLHVVAYLGVLAGFELATVAGDVVKRPYITAGFSALLLLIPLAATSTRGWQRRLGRRWRLLHRLIYPAAVAAWTHLMWLSKGGFLDPVVYGAILVLLFGERVVARFRRARNATQPGR